jgi:hypothetical protein
MKKLIVIGIVAVMVVGFAMAASAAIEQTWYISMKAVNSVATGNGTLTCGTKAGASDSYTTVGSEDSAQPGGNGARGEITDEIQPLTTLVAKDVRAPLGAEATKTWNIHAWLVGADGATKTAGVVTITAWLAGADLDGTVAVSVQGLGADWAAPLNTTTATRGTVSAPLMTWTANYDGINDVQFQVNASTVTTIPEPGSILALASGLVGLIGFGIRRRK